MRLVAGPFDDLFTGDDEELLVQVGRTGKAAAAGQGRWSPAGKVGGRGRGGGDKRRGGGVRGGKSSQAQ